MEEGSKEAERVVKLEVEGMVAQRVASMVAKMAGVGVSCPNMLTSRSLAAIAGWHCMSPVRALRGSSICTRARSNVSEICSLLSTAMLRRRAWSTSR